MADAWVWINDFSTFLIQTILGFTAVSLCRCSSGFWTFATVMLSSQFMQFLYMVYGIINTTSFHSLSLLHSIFVFSFSGGNTISIYSLVIRVMGQAWQKLNWEWYSLHYWMGVMVLISGFSIHYLCFLLIFGMSILYNTFLTISYIWIFSSSCILSITSLKSLPLSRLLMFAILIKYVTFIIVLHL